MPIFEYVCQDCGTKFEKLVRRGPDGAIATELACPSCGKAHLSEQFSTFAARANGKSSREPAFSCPSGMCQTPDLCGRN